MDKQIHVGHGRAMRVVGGTGQGDTANGAVRQPPGVHEGSAQHMHFGFVAQVPVVRELLRRERCHTGQPQRSIQIDCAGNGR